MAGSSTVDADEVLAIAERFMAAIEAGDMGTLRELYAPEAGVWHNNDGIVQDVDANLATLGWVTTNMTDLRYTDIERQATATGFVQQHVLRATNRAGDEVEVPACLVVQVADGRITRLSEYLDSRHVDRLLAKPSAAK